MKKLEDYKLKEVVDLLVNNIAFDKVIPKNLARKLFINALSYNVVVEAINEQIDYLLQVED